jgi:hypothetical protein
MHAAVAEYFQLNIEPVQLKVAGVVAVVIFAATDGCEAKSDACIVYIRGWHTFV